MAMRYCVLAAFMLIGSLGVNAQTDSFEHENRMRYYLEHLPPTYQEDSMYALIIAMHGGFGSGPQLEEQSQLSVTADEEGFIVVYPDGVASPLFGIRTWNAGGCCGYAMEQDIDDVGFIGRLIDTMIDRYSIDPDRIYSTGMSNGGFMSYRLACEMRGRIAAIAPVASSMLTSCAPELAVPVVHFHSYMDENVPWYGGKGSGASNHYNPPLDSVMNVWAGFNACEVLNDTLRDENDYDHIAWRDCHCDADVNLYLSHDGGHSWPGGMGTVIGDPPSEVLDANALMWSFFQQHENCTNPVSGQYPVKTGEAIDIYPNPFANVMTVDCRDCRNNYELQIYSIQGQLKKEGYVSFPAKTTIDCSGLPKGVYYFVLRSGNSQIRRILIKQ